ncbi:MAG: AAA family ATPase [Armatimonadetes bacterium]|nr:AAA family ATPase [Armatimonadota bacterium]
MKQERNLPGIEAPGIYDIRRLPHADFKKHWQSIIVAPELKESLLCQAALNFTMRGRVGRNVVPLHGIILLTGKPGTGKTTLAKGLASETADLIKGNGLTFVEVEPHSLASSALGKTQRAVSDLFATSIAEIAMQGPTVVLLDEVETILVDRAKLSLDANPIDVHRATDAALVALDHLAEKHPNLLIIATSNFPQAIDGAFVSRCDVVFEVPLPDSQASHSILANTLDQLSNTYPELRGFTRRPQFAALAAKCVGLDGRQIRKLVAAACTFDKKTALNPGLLTEKDIERAALRALKDVRR